MVNMETTNENINDFPFIKHMYNQAKHLQEGFSAEQNNFVKNKINQDSFYWKLKEKTEKLEKDNEAYRINMRTLQLEYENMSAQFQEEARLRPEVLNKVNATHLYLISLQKHLTKIKSVELLIQEDYDTLLEMYKGSSEEFENGTCDINRAKKNYEIICTAEKEKNQVLLEKLRKVQEEFCVMKQDSHNCIQELKSKFETAETNNKETALKNVELQAMVATLRFEMQKKEEEITKLQEYSDSIQQKNIEMEKRIQDAERTLLKCNESMTLMTENVMKTEEKLRSIHEQLCDTIKKKDCSDESAKLTLEKLITLEEKFQVTGKKLNDAEETVAKLLLEIKEKDSEIKIAEQRIAELNVLETEINEKNSIIKDIKDKYNMTVNENEELLARICEYNKKIEELKKTLESERETVNTNANMISRMISQSKSKDEALSNAQLELIRTQEDLAHALSRCAKMETSEKENVQKREELEKEVQALRQWATEQRQRDFLSPVNMQVMPEREKQSEANNNAHNNEIDHEEINQRFDSMMQGNSISHLPLSGLRKSHKRTNDVNVSPRKVDFPTASKQAKVQEYKERKFFKSKPTRIYL